MSFDSFHDTASEVQFDDLDSLAGRIGARLARTWAIEEEAQGNGGTPARLMTAWGQVNLWHEFAADTTVEFSSATGFIPFSADLDESWIEFGLGGTCQLTQTASLYGNVNYRTTFDVDA